MHTGMHKRLIPTGALALALVAPAAVAGAQAMGATRAFTIGIAAGATVPTGDFGDVYGTGFNVMGTIGFQPAALPVGLQFDVAYHSLGVNDDLLDPGEEADDLSIISGTGNVVLTVSNTGGVRPYLIGGIGMYRVDPGNGLEASTDFGINGGGGLEFGLAGFSTFLEARYHSVFTEGESNVNLIPVVFGIRF